MKQDNQCGASLAQPPLGHCGSKLLQHDSEAARTAKNG